MRNTLYILTFIILMPFGVSAQNLLKLSGIVRDSLSGDPVKGVNVVVESNSTGTISNSQGAYVLYLTEGEYKISFSSKGYENQALKVELKSNAESYVEMEPKIKALKADANGNRRFFSFLNHKNDRNQMIADKIE